MTGTKIFSIFYDFFFIEKDFHFEVFLSLNKMEHQFIFQVINAPVEMKKEFRLFLST